MALDGPTQDNTALFKQIMAAKGTEKESLMKALSPELKREFVKHLQFSIAVKKVERLEGVVADCDAREAALAAQDKSLLVNSSASYAKSVGSVQQSQTPVHTGSAVKTVTKFGY